MKAGNPLLSIIITSYTMERLKDIFELLDGIKAQTYPNIETIFVGERSEELYEKVKEYGERVLGSRFQVIGLNINSEHRTWNLEHRTLIYGEPGLSAARNLGIKQANGDIIAFIDDDALPFTDWADEMVRTYEDKSIIGVTGPALPLWEDESMAWFPQEFYWIISCTAWFDCNRVREVRNAWGMNMSFRKEAFDSGGLFLPSFGLRSSRAGWSDPPSEDVDLSLRVRKESGKRIAYNPRVKVKHRVYKYRLTPGFIAQRAYSVGHQRRMLRRLYPEANAGADLLSQEHQLLKRIFVRLSPEILKGFFKNPFNSWRKLRVTVIALSFVALGYFPYPFAGLFTRRKPVSR